MSVIWELLRCDILDIVSLDMQPPQYIGSDDTDVTIVDASSDMLVIDISILKAVRNLVLSEYAMGALYLF
jgi:hypothetical protein